MRKRETTDDETSSILQIDLQNQRRRDRRLLQLAILNSADRFAISRGARQRNALDTRGLFRGSKGSVAASVPAFVVRWPWS